MQESELHEIALRQVLEASEKWTRFMQVMGPYVRFLLGVGKVQHSPNSDPFLRCGSDLTVIISSAYHRSPVLSYKQRTASYVL